MALPLVTVIIPTYNYRQYILEAIDSVIKQTYPASLIEIIVIDDGSTDDTREVLLPLINSNTIAYFYQLNKGKANATRNGIERSTGKYIFNLDADDFFFPQKIERTVAVFEANPDVVHVASPAKFVNHDTNQFSIEDIPENILEKPVDGKWLLNWFYSNHILFGGGTTYSARASVLKAITIPDSVDMYIDEFLIVALLPYGKSYFVGEPLSVWREHSSNYSGTTSKEKAIAKGERLLRSSSAMLQYIEDNGFSSYIVSVYRLLHETRKLVYKESIHSKSIRDILVYGRNVFFTIRPDRKLIKKYHVLNRFIPSGVLMYLKSLRRNINRKR